MRVTIEHREQSKGLTGNRKDCYVDCRVEFSEEERSVIKVRDLYGQSFTIHTSTAPPTMMAFWGTNIMRLIGRLMIVGGFFYGVIFEVIFPAGTSIGAPIFFLGLALEIYGWIRTRREDKRIDNAEQTITVKQLLKNPTFTVHAYNAGVAKGVEEMIRQRLVGLKDTIASSAELQPKHTFEL